MGRRGLRRRSRRATARRRTTRATATRRTRTTKRAAWRRRRRRRRHPRPSRPLRADSNPWTCATASSARVQRGSLLRGSHPRCTAPHASQLSAAALAVGPVPSGCSVALLPLQAALHLRALHLDRNEIGGRGARALALALEQRGSGLPPGWFSAVGLSSGRPYYFRRELERGGHVLGAAQWEPPPGAGGSAGGGAGDGAQGGAGGSGVELSGLPAPLVEFGLSRCQLHDEALAAVLDAIAGA
eukprot:2101172-Prymnesium_polylepis.1